jgi:hypothetical protein
MGGWLVSLATWLRLPTRSGIAELDVQIAKLRMLRDSYQAALHERRPDHVPGEASTGSVTC